MTVLDPNNTSDLFQKSIEERYWRMVKDTLWHVFRIRPASDQFDGRKVDDLADQYRALLSEAPAAERILAYHADPIHVAADLAGVQVTDEHLLQYDRIVRNVLPL